jgi:DNA-binding response OmpR family regulator
MDGWDTLAAIRRRALGGKVGIILCTVKSHPADAVRAWELGCDAYLGKPFDIHELAATTLTLANLTLPQRLAGRRRALAAAREAVDHS